MNLDEEDKEILKDLLEKYVKRKKNKKMKVLKNIIKENSNGIVRRGFQKIWIY